MNPELSVFEAFPVIALTAASYQIADIIYP
jgi:hypothetical protein